MDKATKALAISVLSKNVSASRLTLFDRVLKGRTKKVRIVMENLLDEQNAAACIRTIEGFGIQHIHLIESYNKFHISNVVCKGADKWLTIDRHTKYQQCIDQLKEEGFKIYASNLAPNSVPFDQLPLDEDPESKYAFVFGNENRGISTAISKAADKNFVLPMTGFTESFNVSVAVGITIANLYNKNMLKPNMTESDMEDIKFKWLTGTLHGSRQILAKNSINIDDL